MARVKYVFLFCFVVFLIELNVCDVKPAYCEDSNKCYRSVLEIALDPQQPDTVYMSMYGGESNDGSGIYKSVNGGARWDKTMTGIFGQLIINTKNPSVIYSGRHKSTDGGVRWNEMKMPKSRSGSVHAYEKDILYAVIEGNIYKSIDNGEHWSIIESKWDGYVCRMIVMDPQNTETFYVCAYKEEKVTYPGRPRREGGIFKSIDGGKSWNMLLPTIEITKLVVDPNNSSIIYAATYGNGVYRSTDGGKQWNTVNRGLSLFDNDAFVNTLVIDPANSNTIYIGTRVGVFKSTDQGLNWKSVSNGLNMNTLVQSLAIDLKNSNTIFAGTASVGIFKSTDAGENWKPVNNGLPCGKSTPVR